MRLPGLSAGSSTLERSSTIDRHYSSQLHIDQNHMQRSSPQNNSQRIESAHMDTNGSGGMSVSMAANQSAIERLLGSPQKPQNPISPIQSSTFQPNHSVQTSSVMHRLQRQDGQWETEASNRDINHGLVSPGKQAHLPTPKSLDGKRQNDPFQHTSIQFQIQTQQNHVQIQQQGNQRSSGNTLQFGLGNQIPGSPLSPSARSRPQPPGPTFASPNFSSPNFASPNYSGTPAAMVARPPPNTPLNPTTPSGSTAAYDGHTRLLRSIAKLQSLQLK